MRRFALGGGRCAESWQGSSAAERHSGKDQTWVGAEGCIQGKEGVLDDDDDDDERCDGAESNV